MEHEDGVRTDFLLRFCFYLSLIWLVCISVIKGTIGGKGVGPGSDPQYVGEDPNTQRVL